jgi:hypothetical protein
VERAPNACQSASIPAVTAHAAEYLHTWIAEPIVIFIKEKEENKFAPALARVLITGGRGPARVFTCKHILRHVELSEPLLRRALSLVRPGELRVVHVASARTLELILTMLQAQEDAAGAPGGLALSQALHSLRGLVCHTGIDGRDPATTLIERYAATLTHLDCMTDCDNEVASQAVARCHRLESLEFVLDFLPSAWLGLTQLHTLCGVYFTGVPVAVIAAALPRLHTLHASNTHRHDFAVGEFFDDLLPRLQSFHFQGWWPEEEADAAPRSWPPLPRLHDLHWLRDDRSQDLRPMPLPSGFMGARPVSLRGHPPVIVEWLTTVEAAWPPGPAAHGPLAEVRDLSIHISHLEAPDLERLLRAAPQLRRLTLNCEITGKQILEAAFADLRVHPRLRHVVIRNNRGRRSDEAPAEDCTLLLRQRYFPQLRRLTVDGQEYPVSRD